MTLQIHMLSLGALQTNCFIVSDNETRDAFVIDPSDQADQILAVLNNNSYSVKKILLTHGHFDHLLAAQPVKSATGAELGIHAADAPQLAHAKEIAAMYGISIPETAAHDFQIDEGDIFAAGAIKLETVYTPGHSPGHVSFILASESVVFSGDCLFQGSIGRTDLPGGNYEELMTSIETKLLSLGDDYTVCSGHGPLTTIGQEKQTNPFVRQWMHR